MQQDQNLMPDYPDAAPAARSRRCPLVLFGSQTGTAADVADKVWRRALMHGAQALRDVRVRAADAYLEELPASLVAPLLPDEWAAVFICATAGQGDPPDNMARFWRRLMRKAVPAAACAGLKVAVLGLGDSSYPKYNFVAKKLFRRLLQLGAQPLLPLALADDQHPLGIDATLSGWLDDLLRHLVAASGSPITGPPSGAPELPFKFRVDRFLTEAEATAGRMPEPRSSSDGEEEEEEEAAFFPPGALCAQLVSNERITSSDHFQDTRHVVMTTPAAFPVHRPGQVLMVQPRNPPSLLAAFFELLHPSLGPRTRLSILPAHPNCHPVAMLGWPQPCSLSWLARHIFDLNAVPRKAFFELLAAFSPDATERERLEEFCDPANLDELLQYCQHPRRTCLEVLQDFPATSRRLQARHLLELLPQIRPRAFSIASSAVAHPGQLQLLVAVVSYKTKGLVRRRTGLCSNFLASAAPGAPVPVWLSPSPGLRFPAAPGAPVLLVGPGTGLAPFRSLLAERRCRREEAEEEEAEEGGVRDLLVFGCRYKDKDFYFREEWEDLVAKSMLELSTAFSREETNADGSRLYVQDRLRERAAQVCRLLVHSGGCLYVAGNSKNMPDSVREAIVLAVQSDGVLDAAEAETFVQQLEKSGRYQSETWA